MRRLLVALTVLAALGSSAQSVAALPVIVQHAEQVCSAATSCTATLASPTTTGNALIFVISDFYDGAANGGVPWTADENSTGSTLTTATCTAGDGTSSGHIEIFSLPNITGRSGHAATGHYSAATYSITQLFEVSGLASSALLDGCNSSFDGTTAGTWTTTSVTTTGSNDLVLGVVHFFSSTITITPGGGFGTPVYAIDSTNVHEHASSSQVGISPGTYSFSGSFSSTPAASDSVIVVAFKASGGSPPPPTRPCLLSSIGVGCESR